MKTLNVIQQINELKQILSYSKKIGFFFGAGTSCAFGLPNVYTLTDETKKRLTGEEKQIFDEAEKATKDLAEDDNVTVEDILNYIRQIKAITKSKGEYKYNNISGLEAKNLDIQICKHIYDIIKEKEEKVDLRDIRKFFAWYESTSRSFIKEIYTTNYDMLFEKGMEANFIPYFDGFVGSYQPFFSPESIDNFPGANDSTNNWIRLWKIHGSLNWIVEKDESSNTKRIIRSCKFESTQNELMVYPSRDKYNLSRREPYIAYFDRLKKYLIKGELLFLISGYSFSDQHINEVLFDALRQNSRLYLVVFCFNDAQVEMMEQYAPSHMNLCVLGPKKGIINGRLSSWMYKENEDELDTSSYWDENNDELLLGDFPQLINFLIDNSGNRSIIEEVVNGK